MRAGRMQFVSNEIRARAKFDRVSFGRVGVLNRQLLFGGELPRLVLSLFTLILFAPLRPLKSKLTAAATLELINEGRPGMPTSAPVPAVGVLQRD